MDDEFDDVFDDEEWSPQPTRGSYSDVNLTPGNQEKYLLTLSDKYEQATLNYAKLCSDVASADADYHYAFYSAMVSLPDGVRPAEKRKAKASLEAHKEYANWRMLQERQKASLQYLQSLKMKLEIGRTISANMRNMT
jgi:hypothetical protein